MKRDDWEQAVWEAIFRICDRNGTRCFTRRELFDTEPLKTMVFTSRNKGQNPEMSDSYTLSDFTRLGEYARIKRIGRGIYEITDSWMPVFHLIKDHFRPREHGATKENAMATLNPAHPGETIRMAISEANHPVAGWLISLIQYMIRIRNTYGFRMVCVSPF